MPLAYCILQVAFHQIGFHFQHNLFLHNSASKTNILQTEQRQSKQVLFDLRTEYFAITLMVFALSFFLCHSRRGMLNNSDKKEAGSNVMEMSRSFLKKYVVKEEFCMAIKTSFAIHWDGPCQIAFLAFFQTIRHTSKNTPKYLATTVL